MNRKAFDILLAKMLDGSIQEDELELLVREAAQDEQLQSALLEQIRIDEGVRLLLHDSRGGPTFAEGVAARLTADADRFEFLHRVLDRTDERTQRTLFRRVALVAGLLTCTAALLLAAIWANGPRQSPTQLAAQRIVTPPPLQVERRAVPPLDAGVATVKQLLQVEWSDAAGARVGDALTTGRRLRQRAGTTQVQFYRGAVVTLEGPAELEVRGINEAILHSGKAWANVPEPAQGFVLLTPDIEVVDLGTEFGVEVVPGQRTEVSVFSGEVELHDPRTGRVEQSAISLTTGQGLSFGSGLPQAIAVDRAQFGSDEQLRARQQRKSLEGFERWRQWSAAARQDPRVLIYYRFEPEDENATQLANEALDAEEAAGYVIGGQWTEGRWRGKQALDFKRPSDRIRFHLDGEYDAVTLAAWVRIDGLDRPLCSLMLTDGYEFGEVHWQFNDKGQLGLAIESTCNRYSESLVDLTDLGKWIHVASSYDRVTGEVHQYFNGERVDSLQVDHPVAARFGAAEIGNWSQPVSQPPLQIRNFNGRMDEFLLYGTALDESEVRAMYEAGKPH